LGRSTKYETPHCATSSILPSPHPSLVQIFFSEPCSQTPSVQALPLVRHTLFHTRTKQLTELWFCIFWPLDKPGSSGSIVSNYGLDDRAIGVRSPAGAEDSSSSICVQTDYGAHPASCKMGTWGPFLGGKARPGRDADHSPPSGAEVVNEYELYLLSPQAPPWRVEGLLYFTFYVPRQEAGRQKTMYLTVASFPRI
jgi:hypothetical protein